MNIEITEEMVEAIVERKVDERIEGGSLDYMIRERVNTTVDEAIRKQIGLLLDERFNAIAESEAGAFIDKAVEICDGWGHRERYDSYADFFAAELKKRFERREIERTIQDVVKKKVEESINGRAKEIVKRVCDEIIVEAGGAEK